VSRLLGTSGCLARRLAFFRPVLLVPIPTYFRPMIRAEASSPKLLHQVRRAVRVRHYSPRTEESYVGWVKRYVRFHGLRHPGELGVPEVTRFLSTLAESGQLSASSQTQALSALLFLYRDVLHHDLGSLGEIARAKQPSRLPVVLTKDEVRALLARLNDAPRVAALLMYGSGLRLLEALQLRVKDLDFTMRQITIRRAKGGRDRVTVLPDSAAPVLRNHLAAVREQHVRDLSAGAGRVALPFAYDRKSPHAAKEWAGSSSSRPVGAIATRPPTSWCAITCTSRWCSERSRPRSGRAD
jgi:integrase